MGRRGKNAADDMHYIDHPNFVRMCLECRRQTCNNCIKYMNQTEKEAIRNGMEAGAARNAEKQKEQ